MTFTASEYEIGGIEYML